MTEEKKPKIKEVTPKCPGCGSTNMDIPKSIEKREDGFFIKGTDLQLLTLPDPAYVCLDCSREMSVDELMRSIGHI
ncbi:MAG: hypothetical protein WC788_06045 [Candidatus Paceibacterota bacterium]